MTIKLTGPLTMDEIDAEFGKGKNLGAYHGVAWWTDPPTNTKGNFSNGAISFNDFYGKRKDAPFSIGNSIHIHNNGWLQHDMTAAGNTKTSTFSAWVKHENGGSLFTAGNTWAPRQRYNYRCISSGITWDVSTIGAPPAGGGPLTGTWHHVVYITDTTAGTPMQRGYVDGVLVTQASQWSANSDTPMAAAVNHSLGRTLEGDYFTGFVADVNFIDGAAVLPSAFAAAGKPIAYTGSYGTNGFHLTFSDPADLGHDSGPNGRHFTLHSLTAADASTDHP